MLFKESSSSEVERNMGNGVDELVNTVLQLLRSHVCIFFSQFFVLLFMLFLFLFLYFYFLLSRSPLSRL